MNGSYTTRQSVLYFPENSSSKIDIMLHQSHSAVFRPAFFVIVTNNILVVWIRILGKESLNQLSGLIRYKSENNINMINVTHVHSYGVSGLNFN